MMQPEKILGLIGRNISYSRSPLIHNTACDLLALPYVYTIFNIASAALIEPALSGARALGIAGLNVTTPYKTTVVPFLDELSPEAASIGAVNTIVNNNGHLVGYNTDIAGFAAPLHQYAQRIEGNPVSVFGNGGAALAAIEAFRIFFRPACIFLFVRDIPKATAMLQDYAHRDIVTLCLMKELVSGESTAIARIRRSLVLVNATPIGTTGRHDDSETSIVPLDAGLLHHNQIVYDMVYNPPCTPLLKAAKALGGETVSGIEMLLGQAARSFELWTGKKMPLEQVRTALMQNLLSCP
jgi:shikimate dehydrogenase